MLQNEEYSLRKTIAHLGMSQVKRALFFCVVQMIPLHTKLQIIVAEAKENQSLSKEMKEQICVIFT